MSDVALKLVESRPAAPLTVKELEARGLAPATSFEELFDEEITTGEVLERLSPGRLETAPLGLLTATALAISSDATAPYVEDRVVRYREGLTSEHAAASYVRLAAEQLVLADVERQQAVTRYAEIEAHYPERDQFSSSQIFVEACKLHERRMDRLLKAQKETFDRYDRAAEIYRVALLTREGQEVLVQLATKTRNGRPATTGSAPVPVTPAALIGAQEGTVEVLPAETGVGGEGRDVKVLIHVR